MIRLIRAETARLLSRRFTVITMIVVVLAIGAFQLVVIDAFNQPAAEPVPAQTTDPGQPTECQDPDVPAEECTPAEDDGSGGGDVVRPPFAEVATLTLTVSIYLAALSTFMIAGSFIGAEFTSGSISNWLSFVPRRIPVFVSKLFTITVFSALFSAACGALTLGAAVVLAGIHDVPVEEIGKLMALSARGLIPAVALAAVGFCAGLLSRHTAAAIGVLLGYLFLWFVRNGPLSQLAWAQRLTPWTPEGNLSAVVGNGSTYEVVVDEQTYETVERHISLAHGIGYWVALVAVLAVVTGLVFRSRDVT